MAPKGFVLHLAPHQSVYYPGQPIRGSVIFTISEPTNVRAIYYVVSGKGLVRWSEERRTGTGENQRRETRTYIAKEKYFYNKAALDVGGVALDGCMTLSPGSYNIPFITVIPSANVPSSFEGSFGHIRYKIKAVMDRPMHLDIKFQMPIIVNAIVDLNLHPTAKLGISGENSKEICCLCCTGGSINLRVSVPKGGFTAGENVPMCIEVENGSSDPVKVAVELMQYVKFHAQCKSKYDTCCLENVDIGEVVGNSKEVFNKYIPVGNIPPTDLGCGCSIININYAYKVKVKPPGLSMNLNQDVPVLIGTVPILDLAPPSYFNATTPHQL